MGSRCGQLLLKICRKASQMWQPLSQVTLGDWIPVPEMVPGLTVTLSEYLVNK